MYTKITDWREASYLKNLKNLLRNLYSIGVNNKTYNKLWQPLEQRAAEVQQSLDKPAFSQQRNQLFSQPSNKGEPQTQASQTQVSFSL